MAAIFSFVARPQRARQARRDYCVRAASSYFCRAWQSRSSAASDPRTNLVRNHRRPNRQGAHPSRAIRRAVRYLSSRVRHLHQGYRIDDYFLRLLKADRIDQVRRFFFADAPLMFHQAGVEQRENLLHTPLTLAGGVENAQPRFAQAMLGGGKRKRADHKRVLLAADFDIEFTLDWIRHASPLTWRQL